MTHYPPPKEIAKKLMDWNAGRYHAISDPQIEWGRRVMRRLAPVSGERILDLGCGTARLTTMLLEIMGEGHVVGLDRSETMLREAAGRKATRPPITPLHDASIDPSRISYVRADGAALPFAGAFDAVFSTAALHWMPDHDAVFASVYSALAAGGRFVAQCGGGRNLRTLFERAAALMQEPAFASYFATWREPWEFADVPTTMMRLERAGFTSIDVSITSAPTVLPDKPSYAEFVELICLRPHLALLPEAERPKFVEAIADQAASDPEPFTLDYWRLNIAARKPAAAEQAA
jgi:trans-aconitate 2-methyltransferase